MNKNNKLFLRGPVCVFFLQVCIKRNKHKKEREQRQTNPTSFCCVFCFFAPAKARKRNAKAAPLTQTPAPLPLSFLPVALLPTLKTRPLLLPHHSIS